MNDTIPKNQEEVKSENNICVGKPFDDVGGVIKLKRPRGGTPSKPVPSVLYWSKVLIRTLFVNTWLLMGVIGGVGGYYIGNTFETALFGLVLGIAMGRLFSEDMG